MDHELLTQILALLTGAWTLYQEVRHRKNAKKSKKASLDDIMPPKPVETRGKK